MNKSSITIETLRGLRTRLLDRIHTKLKKGYECWDFIELYKEYTEQYKAHGFRTGTHAWEDKDYYSTLGLKPHAGKSAREIVDFYLSRFGSQPVPQEPVETNIGNISPLRHRFIIKTDKNPMLEDNIRNLGLEVLRYSNEYIIEGPGDVPAGYIIRSVEVICKILNLKIIIYKK